MKKKEIWFDEYRGIRFEINKFEATDYASGWTFYLYLSPQQFPESVRDSLYPKLYFTQFGTPIEYYGYGDEMPISQLDWHGGLTWSSNETKPGRPFESFKFGCDFQHLWDMHQTYSLDGVKKEVELCIDSLWLRFPELKTMDKLWDEFRAKFPGEKTEHRCFDVDAKPIERD